MTEFLHNFLTIKQTGLEPKPEKKSEKGECSVVNKHLNVQRQSKKDLIELNSSAKRLKK